MTFKYPFLTIIHDLGKATDHLVLVGGWVPTVYFEYLWKSPREVFRTVDVDLGLSFIKNQPAGKLMIDELSFSKNYHRKHLKLGKERPYQLIFNSNISIDFLVDPRDAKKIRTTILGPNIIFNEGNEYRALLQSPIELDCDGVIIRVPQPARYLAHKIFVYLSNKNKRKKDLATGYYCLTRSPDPDAMAIEFTSLQFEPMVQEINKQKLLFVNAKTSSIFHDIQQSLGTIGIDEDLQDIQESFKKLFAHF